MARSCVNSYTCGHDHCCRDANNHVISTSNGNIFIGPLLGDQMAGRCVAGTAQKGEKCDGTCKCDTGLSCFRPMSGACCPPSTCVDAEYAKKQNEYWSKCMQDINCPLPA